MKNALFAPGSPRISSQMKEHTKANSGKKNKTARTAESLAVRQKNYCK